MLEFTNIDISEFIPENFLTLSINIGDFTDEYISTKYTPELVQKLISRRNDLALLEQSINNPKFSISIKQDIYITKKRNSADLTVAIDKDADDKVRIVKELKDPNNTHNFSFSNIIEAINDRIASERIPFKCIIKSTGIERDKFNKSDLSLFIKFYDIKNNPELTYAHKKNGQITMYTYSPKLISFIIEQTKNNPGGIIADIKERQSINH